MSGRKLLSRGLLLASTLALCLAGCRPAPKPPAADAPVSPTSSFPEAPKEPPAPSEKPRLSSEAAGPVRLGMTAEQVQKLPGLTAVTSNIQIEGTTQPTLQIRRGTRSLMMAEIVDGKVWRLTITSPEYRTPEGAGLGTLASRLEQIYGTPDLMLDEGAVCAVFKKAPGLSFCFAPGSGPQVKTWKDVVRRNLGVAAILVVGKD